jgi:hypothetical protein
VVEEDVSELGEGVAIKKLAEAVIEALKTSSGRTGR